MDEELKEEKFNQLLKNCLEGGKQQAIVLNDNSKQMLEETNKVLEKIESNWNDLKQQRENSGVPLTAEEWAMKKVNVNKSE